MFRLLNVSSRNANEKQVLITRVTRPGLQNLFSFRFVFDSSKLCGSNNRC